MIGALFDLFASLERLQLRLDRLQIKSDRCSNSDGL